MASSRRKFLSRAAGFAGAVAVGSMGACRRPGSETSQAPGQMPAGSLPVFGAAPPVGPEVSAAAIAEAEKLTQVQYTSAERRQAAGNWRESLALPASGGGLKWNRQT